MLLMVVIYDRKKVVQIVGFIAFCIFQFKYVLLYEQINII